MHRFIKLTDFSYLSRRRLEAAAVPESSPTCRLVGNHRAEGFLDTQGDAALTPMS
jgi:hypothetical protein